MLLLTSSVQRLVTSSAQTCNITRCECCASTEWTMWSSVRLSRYSSLVWRTPPPPPPARGAVSPTRLIDRQCINLVIDQRLARYSNILMTVWHRRRPPIQQSCSIIGPRTARTITTIIYRLTTLQPQTPCTLPTAACTYNSIIRLWFPSTHVIQEHTSLSLLVYWLLFYTALPFLLSCWLAFCQVF